MNHDICRTLAGHDINIYTKKGVESCYFHRPNTHIRTMLEPLFHRNASSHPANHAELLAPKGKIEKKSRNWAGFG